MSSPSPEALVTAAAKPRAWVQVGGGVLARGLSHASTLLVMLAAARWLEPADFGSYVLGTALVSFGMLFIYAGVYEYLLRADDDALHANTGFSVLLATALVLAFLLWGGASLAARVFSSPALAWMLKLFAVIPLAGCLSAWREAMFLRDERHVARYNLIVMARDLLSLAIGLAALALGLGLAALVVWRLSPALLGWAAWRWQVPRRPRLDLGRARWREVLAYGGGITGSRLAMFAEANGVDLLLGLLLQPAAVGLYRMASRLVGSLVDLLAQPMAKLAWVQVSLAARQGQPVQAECARWHRLLLLLAWPGLAFVGLAAEPLASAVLGPRWVGAAPAITALAAAAIVRSSAFALEPLFAVAGRSLMMMQLRTVAAAFALSGVALAGLGGLAAVAWGQVAAASVGVLIFVSAAQRHAGLDSAAWARALVAPSAVLLAMVVVAWGLRHAAWPAAAAVVVIATVGAAGTITALWRSRGLLGSGRTPATLTALPLASSTKA